MYKLIETIRFKQSLCSINEFFFKLHCIRFYSSVLQDRVDSKCTSQPAELMHSCKANFFCNTDNSLYRCGIHFKWLQFIVNKLYDILWIHLQEFLASTMTFIFGYYSSSKFCLSIKIALVAFIGSRKKWKNIIHVSPLTVIIDKREKSMSILSKMFNYSRIFVMLRDPLSY